MPKRTRTILHVDMDAFFAAVEQRDRPELRGKPVVVGSPPDKRGVVSTCSYEARKYGIHSAMPSRTAYQRCPHAVFLPVDGPKYVDVSRQVMAIFHDFTPMVEKVSIDEAFLDVRGALRKYGDAVTIARLLKRRIRENLNLTASVGVATNKFLAKLASDMDKPDGLTVVPFAQKAIEEFLAPLPVTTIWGVGKVTAQKLHKFGIRSIGDLQKTTPETLSRWLGPNHATHLSNLAHGLDERPVVTEREEKSISNEETFAVDCRDMARVEATLIQLTEKVGRRLRKAGKLARTGQIKVRFEDFTTITRQRAFTKPCDSDRELVRCALDLLENEKIKRPVRLIGFGAMNLLAPEEAARAPQQPLLFDVEDLEAEDRSELDRNLDQAVDRLRSKFGDDILKRGI